MSVYNANEYEEVIQRIQRKIAAFEERWNIRLPNRLCWKRSGSGKRTSAMRSSLRLSSKITCIAAI